MEQHWEGWTVFVEVFLHLNASDGTLLGATVVVNTIAVKVGRPDGNDDDGLSVGGWSDGINVGARLGRSSDTGL